MVARRGTAGYIGGRQTDGSVILDSLRAFFFYILFLLVDWQNSSLSDLFQRRRPNIFFFLMTLCRFFIKLFSVSYWEKEKNKKTINCREFSSSLRFILLRQNSIQAARDKYLLWGFCGLKHCDYKNAVEWRQHFEIIQKKKLVIYSGWNDYKKKKWPQVLLYSQCSFQNRVTTR
jgi:hypothetical protein